MVRGLRRISVFTAAGLLLAVGSGLAMAGVVELEGTVQMHILPQPGATVLGGPVHGPRAAGPFTGQEPLAMEFSVCCVDVTETGAPDFSWDFDFDGGTFDEDAFGPGPSPYTYNDGPETHYVALQMRMPSGKEYLIVEEVRITNVAPTLQVGGPFTAEAGVPVTLEASGADPSPADMAVGLQYAWDYDFMGAFTPDQTVIGMTSPTVVYPYPGAYTVAVQVIDKDGARSSIKSSIVKVSGAPVAHNLTLNAGYQTPTNLTLKASIDPSKGPATFAIVSQPQHGTLTGAAPQVIYTPYNGYTGADSFTYTASDGQEASTLATVAILVTPPAPTPTPTPAETSMPTETVTPGPSPTAAATSTPLPATPTANNFSVTTYNGVPVNVTLSGTIDPTRGPKTFAIVTQPQHGTLSGALPNLAYSPYTGFVGTDTFTYIVSDGQTTSPIATVTIQILSLTATPTLMPTP